MGEPLATARLKWEYAWEEIPKSQWAVAMTRRGNDGWEAWCQYEGPAHGANWVVIFKRPLLQTNEVSGS